MGFSVKHTFTDFRLVMCRAPTNVNHSMSMHKLENHASETKEIDLLIEFCFDYIWMFSCLRS